MNKSILWVMLCAGFGALAIAQFAIAQSTYPSRAVRLVVPTPFRELLDSGSAKAWPSRSSSTIAAAPGAS